MRVLVVDDSAFMRHSVSRVLGAQPDFEVVGKAADGIEAIEMIRRLRPDVVTLDVEMPRMDGLKALEVVMREMPLPVVMLSSMTEAGAPATIKALELGAVDFVTKPAPPAVGVGSVEEPLLRAVRAAARARIRPARRPTAHGSTMVASAALVDGVLGSPSRSRKPDAPLPARRADRVLAIGCSTGGPKALMELVPKLPANLPASVLIVQHMPAGFTRSLAERLNEASALHVKEAAHGDIAGQGLVLLAPGGQHMELDTRGRVLLTDAQPVHGVRPSVDVLFRTLPAVFGHRCVAAVLTGMGSDGADGAALLHEAGGQIVIEDESTCVVYGMPRAVAERGLADKMAPIQKIAAAVTDLILAQTEAKNCNSETDAA